MNLVSSLGRRAADRSYACESFHELAYSSSIYAEAAVHLTRDDAGISGFRAIVEAPCAKALPNPQRTASGTQNLSRITLRGNRATVDPQTSRNRYE
jgi:hypothetical protein